MKRFIALAAVLLLPAVGLMAEARPAQPQQPPITAPGITKDMLDTQAPQPPQLICFRPDQVQGFSYRAATNSLRVTTALDLGAQNQSYDVSFFVPCGGLASTDALTFDGVTNDQVCGSGIESVVFYSTEQGPKRCSIRDVKQQAPVAHMGR